MSPSMTIEQIIKLHTGYLSPVSDAYKKVGLCDKKGRLGQGAKVILLTYGFRPDLRAQSIDLTCVRLHARCFTPFFSQHWWPSD